MRRSRSRRTSLLSGNGPLAAVPPIAAFAVVIALFTVAVVVGGVLGAVLLGLLALGVGVLIAATWHAHTAPARAGRVVILAVLIAVAVSVVVAG